MEDKGEILRMIPRFLGQVLRFEGGTGLDDHVSEGPRGDLGYAQYAVGYIREMRGIWS